MIETSELIKLLSADHFRLFATRSGMRLAEPMAASMKVPLGNAHIETFADGEIIVKVNDDVRGRDCFVVAPTSNPVNDNLMELLIFLDCLKRASAKHINVVIPYFGYARQDRKSHGREPITAKLIADLLQQAGADRVIALDLHAAQLQGFFDIPVDHLTATPVFFEHFRSRREELGDLVIFSPDVGNLKVAEAFANLLHADIAVIHKQRVSGSEVRARKMIGSVKGKTALLFDDMIATGGTIIEAANYAMEQGATRVIAAATHAVLAGNAPTRLWDSSIAEIITTDSIPTQADVAVRFGKFKTLSVARLLAEAVVRIHFNQSVSQMFNGSAGVKR